SEAGSGAADPAPKSGRIVPPGTTLAGSNSKIPEEMGGSAITLNAPVKANVCPFPIVMRLPPFNRLTPQAIKSLHPNAKPQLKWVPPVAPPPDANVEVGWPARDDPNSTTVASCAAPPFHEIAPSRAAPTTAPACPPKNP